MKVLLANPRGFCAGVDRALEIVDATLEKYGAPVYVYHEIIHNDHVVKNLKSCGVVFVNSIAEVPHKSVLIFSAHGVSKEVQQEAIVKELKVIDATCPLVAKVHTEVSNNHSNGYQTILVGHANHDEIVGTLGQVSEGIHLVESVEDVLQLSADMKKVAYSTQTTLSVDDTAPIINALKQKYPHIKGPKGDDICYATQNRQTAVKQIVQQVDLILVVGSPTSSNCTRLKEVAEACGIKTYFVNSAEEVHENWFNQVNVVGITAGASTPANIVQDVVARLKSFGDTTIEEVDGVNELVHFTLPTL